MLSWVATRLTPYGLASTNLHGSVYPGGTMMPPKWINVMYSDSSVVSWPPCSVLDDVKPAYTLSASLPSAHSPPSESRKLRNCDATEPNRVGEPKITASAQTMSSPVAVGKSLVAS